MARRGNVTIIGMKLLDARLKALPAVVEQGARKATREETIANSDDMRALAPVKTGELKAGVQSEHDTAAIEGRSVSTAPHTKYVVHGTSDTPKQDFITPVALRSRRRYPQRVRREVLAKLREITE